ncbi:hypothetical protein ACIBF7_43220 [Nonomuraea sp. NPDC050478]|uniref:hypothetical protein n=1 Tax=Nonomuraea sp. NPDC050478 TaxID=3364365 RepID=UPI0037926507
MITPTEVSPAARWCAARARASKGPIAQHGEPDRARDDCLTLMALAYGAGYDRRNWSYLV